MESEKLLASSEVKEEGHKEDSESKEAEVVEAAPVECTPVETEHVVPPSKPSKAGKESLHHEKSKPLAIGDATIIPADDIAKLMYYLHCVRKCVDLKISSRLTDYRYYNSLTETEKRDVVIFAHRYRCGVLRKVVFFEVDDESILLPNSPNDFIEYDDPVVTGTLEAQTNSIKIDGEHYTVHKVMVFKYAWLHDYFVLPFSREQWRIGLAPKPLFALKMSKLDGSDDVPMWCFGGVLCCFIFPPIGLVLLAIGACRAGQESAKASQEEQKTSTTFVYT